MEPTTPGQAPAAVAPTPAQPATPPAPTTADLIAAATKALSGPETAEAAPAPAEDPTSPAAPALPSTPEAPATAAALAESETHSTLIRQRNEIADARRAFEAERTKWKTEQAEHVARTAAMERAFAEFERDPAAFAKSRSTKRPLMEIARDLYLEDAELDKLPAEQAAPLRAQREMQQLRRQQAELQQQVQQAQVQQQLAVYRSQLTTGLGEVTEATPLVKELAAKQPARLVQLMESMALDLAVKMPGIGLQSAAQLAARLEPSLAAEMSPFEGYYERKYKVAPAPAPVVAPAAAPRPVAAPPTVSPAVTRTTPASVKPMTDRERIAAATRAFEGQA